MLVVHACWLVDAAGSRLGIWGEDSTRPTIPVRRPGRRPRTQPHPYAAVWPDLLALLPLVPADAGHQTATLTLPTTGGGPVSSPELIRDETRTATDDVRLQPWRVPILEVDADLGLALLRELDPEIVWGASVVHLAEVAAFATDLVDRGRVLPVALTDPPRALWRPVLAGPDAAWARVLASAVPAPVGAAAPDTRLSAWADALDTLVDAAARAALGSFRLDIGLAGDPVSRAWLRALTGAERTVEASNAAMTTLDELIARWQADAVAGPVRACFRLVEPADGEEDWHVRFGLQAADEPSLVVDADKVWRSRGKLPALARHVEAPQETFLAELGKAGRLYPELDDALRTARPLGLALDTDGAHRFLSTAAPTLSTAGFGVQLPGWWTRRSARLGVRLSASTPAQPGQVAASATTVGTGAIADVSLRPGRRWRGADGGGTRRPRRT